jgi:hypothetical protein
MNIWLTNCPVTSVNVISIWRVATVFEHKATTSPTFDPTWYGPISILLTILEVNAATICASVPVFWPVLTARLDKIFVTQEIKIERTHRFSTIDDDYELQHSPTGSGASKESEGLYGVHSRDTSQSSLTMVGRQKGGHYNDKYIAAQVDPLSSVGRVELQISADPKARKGSK